MLKGAYFFETELDATGLFDQFLGGLFYIKGLPLVAQLLMLVFFSISLITAVLYQTKKQKHYCYWSNACSILFFTIAAILLIQPWDELFVNLLHSKNLASKAMYSFSKTSMIEGTVDFLPYFLIGILSKTGLDPLFLTFLMSLFGGISCIFIATKILKEWKILGTEVWGPLLFALYPPLIYNSSHGFSTTLFSAAILLTIYAFFIQCTPSVLSWFTLSCLPLIRTEGAFLLILFPALLWLRKQRQSLLLFTSIAWLPFILLTIWRVKTFHHAIPAPIQFKSAIGDPYFFAIGLRNILSDGIAGYALLGVTAILSLRCLTPSKKEPYMEVLLCLAVFIFPYYLSGGDWFPSGWGRYMFPFSLFVMLASWHSLSDYLSNPKRTKLSSPQICALGTAAFFLIFINPFASYFRIGEDLFALRKTLANTRFKKQKRTNHRIEYLSRVGFHLRATAPKDSRIASSEMATIMYYADREPLDLLGITNYEIIQQPLRTPSFVRRIPKHNELPYLIFRRVNSTLVDKYRPEIIYPFDFILEDLMEDIFPSEFGRERLYQGLYRWQERFQDLMTPLYGGTEKLIQLGYKPFVVKYANNFSALYFVESGSVENHILRLEENQFKGGYVELSKH